MSHIVDDDPPVKTRAASKEYRDNWESIFGEPEVVLETCGCPGAVVRNCPYAADVNNDTEQRCKCCAECAHECAMDI